MFLSKSWRKNTIITDNFLQLMKHTRWSVRNAALCEIKEHSIAEHTAILSKVQ